jgi:uncharacterized protein
VKKHRSLISQNKAQMSRLALSVALFLFQCIGALAIDIPKLQNRVTDLAGVLTADQTAGLDSKLQSFESTDSTQVAVLIIPSLEGEYIADYSIRVAEAWKIGQKGRDNGAILLVSIKDRAIRIEVGYGLEAKLTDARSSQIIRNEIVPRFRQGDYYGGIDAGINAIIETVRGLYQDNPRAETRYSQRSSGRLFNLLIVMLFPLFWILSATGKWGGGILGAGAGMLLPYTLIGHGLISLLIGGVIGGVLGVFLGALVHAGAKSGRGLGSFGGPFFWGGGGGGFGSGGFSGGGGGFGGGGSSGNW